MADPVDRLDELISQQEASIRAAFRQFVQTVGGEGPVFDAVMAKLEARDTDGALKIVESYIASMANVLPAVAVSVGIATAAELAELIPESAVGISFDPSHPRAAEIIRDNRARFVREFSDQQRKATLQALAEAYREGLGTQQTARLFRESIGLTQQQQAAVRNYRRLLERGSRDALNRANRDRRFDRSVQAAAEGRRQLTPEQIDRMTQRYQQRTLMMRSETIARTEGIRATSEAREETLEQMLEATGLERDRVERVWNPTRDKRTRDFHASMAGQKRPLGTPFKDGHGNLLLYPGDPKAPASTTINCRCALTFSVRQDG